MSNEAQTNDEEWVIATEFDSGDKAWWGTRRDGFDGLTPYRGNSRRYESYEGALNMAEKLQEARLIGPFQIEMLPPKPRLKTHD